MIVKNSNNSLLNQGKIEFRKYQEDIAQKCVNKNSLVILPTGLGKTIIAIFVAAETLRLFPEDSKVILLAPTRPLINQHFNSFIDFLNIPEDKFCILTGMVDPEKRIKLFLSNQLLFFTPQTLRNDLVNKRYTLENVCLIVFDEVHHATGDYPYKMIAEKYLDQNPDGNILGLTASPGASKKKVQQLCKTMHIPLENTHFRTRKDSDVKHYVKPMDIFKISVDPTDLMKELIFILKGLIERRLQYLTKLSFLDSKSGNLVENTMRKDLIKLNKDLITLVKSNQDKTGVYSALSINAQALILYHMIELIEQQGLDNLLVYLEKVYKDAIKMSSSKAIKVLASEQRLHYIFLKLRENQEFSSENIIHPKYEVLEKILLDELRNNTNSRILVFVKFRVSVKKIVDRLKKVKLINPVRFVGQSTRTKDDKGMSQKTQISVLEGFKNGIYNVLVATNVGEEGLDIAECDMVVFYDVVASEIRFIQRKGRTARHREGKVVILFTRGTNDEIYLRIVMNKLKKMNVNLKKPEDLNNFYSKGTKFDFKSEEKKDLLHYSEDPEIKNKNIIVKQRNNQSNLLSFVYDERIKEISKRSKKDEKPSIILSNTIPMKYGLRNKLNAQGISFQVTNFPLHILIANKVLIQLYDSIEISQVFYQKIIDFNKKMSEKYHLVIQIIDFFDYKENFDGEKRALKKKLQKFGKEHQIQLISIENLEELFFILKSIYMNQKTKIG